jgi:hypothetical protein
MGPTCQWWRAVKGGVGRGTTGILYEGACVQGFLSRPVSRTAEVWFWYTILVQPGTAQNQMKSNFKSKSVASWFGLVYRPVRPVYRSGSTSSQSFNKKNELVESLTCFQIWIKNWKNKRKFSKNIARCIESNGVKIFQILVHLVFLRVLEVQPANFFSFFLF